MTFHTAPHYNWILRIWETPIMKKLRIILGAGFLGLMLFLPRSGADDWSMTHPDPVEGRSTNSDSQGGLAGNFSSQEESLYVATIQGGNPDEFLRAVASIPQSRFSGLLACRYLLLELTRGGQPEILVRNLNEIGFQSEILKLYPMIRNKPEHLIRAIAFHPQKIRMWLRENYARQLEEDPYVEWYLDYDRCIHIPFDALHLMARGNYFRVQNQNVQFMASDSLGLDLVRKNFGPIEHLFQDFSEKLGYPSLDEHFSRVFDLRFLMYEKLTVLVYDPDEFQQRYRLKKAGWSYPHYGLIFINPKGKNSREFLSVLLHKLSHIYLAGNLHDIHHGACRWFDEGFAQWAAYSYVNFQQLTPGTDTYTGQKMKDYITDIRREAAQQLSQNNRRIKLSQVNRQCRDRGTLKGEPVSNILSLSLIGYLVENYGAEKVVETAARISRHSQNFTEESLKTVLGVDYDTIEHGWNEWLKSTPSEREAQTGGG